MATYIGYSTHDPYIAEAAYKKRTGETPTVIVCRYEFVLTTDHPLVKRCNNAGAGMLMVSHLITPSEIHDGIHLSITARQEEIERENAARRDEYKSTTTDDDDRIPSHGPGRPSLGEAICPHCQGQIKDFENLGFWYGWQIGIEPPYWEVLRLYVFRRDKYTCQRCGRKLPPNELRCHHVRQKEDGGTDSARNLNTLCSKCHLDEHPIMPDEVEK